MRTHAARIASAPDGVLPSSHQQAIDKVIQRVQHSGADCLLAVSWALSADADALSWLEQLTSTPKLYWRPRWSSEQYAGAGAAVGVRTSGLSSLYSALTDSRQLLGHVECALGVPFGVFPRLFGGAAFDPGTPAPATWAPFGDALFVLPEAVLYSNADESHLILTAKVSPADTVSDIQARLEQLRRQYWPIPGQMLPALPTGAKVSGGISMDDWRTMIASALGMIESDVLRKVVLARAVHWRTDGRLSPWSLMDQLRHATEGSYCFGMQLPQGAAFLSASPERLVRLANQEVETDCIAGTVPRDDDPNRDTELSRELLQSLKDRREHGYVVEGVVETLRGLCTNTDVGGEPWLIRLPTVQHLVTSARARLRGGVSHADVVSQLHPTPAVGGTPRAAALDAIRRLEPEGRGWYAGPVGWIGQDSAEFAVGIRSALVTDADVRVFAGAGIVNGSQPDREWAETEAKAQSILKIIQH